MPLHRLRLSGEEATRDRELSLGEVPPGDLGDEVLESSESTAAKILFRERLDSMWWQDAEGVEGFVDVQEGVRDLLQLRRRVRDHLDEGTGSVRKGTVTS